MTLRTSLERALDRQAVPAGKRALVEEELIREFKRAYHNYSNQVPHKDALVEWLSLMQHHGAPTRFLDFTYSIYIAAYFAIEATEVDAAIWAINGPWALKNSAILLKTAGKDATAIDVLVGRFMEASEHSMNALLFGKPPVLCSIPLNPFRLNERLRIQKGVFLAPGRIDRAFVANLAALPGHTLPRNVLRILIPRRLMAGGLASLFHMNITRTSLFPGLDGYSRALGVHHPVYRPDNMIWRSIKV